MSASRLLLVLAALVCASTPACADPPGASTRGSTVLSACLIVGGASLAAIDAARVMDDGSYTLGVGGVLVGAAGIYYTTQADHVRDATAIRVSGALALVSGVGAILRRAHVLKVPHAPPDTEPRWRLRVAPASMRGGLGVQMALSW